MKLIALLLVFPVSLVAAPAFPGAEGYGASATGGRGYAVVKVTNLNNSGAGSLREALSAGNRIIVFDVGGTITLTNLLYCNESNVTIAGQSAPGDGICLAGHGFYWENASNIVVRYLRCRAGDSSGPPEVTSASFYNCQHVMLDHLSCSWGTDKSLLANPCDYCTVQRCIVSETLYNSVHPEGPHSMSAIIGGSTHFTAHHNLWMSSEYRPLIYVGADVRNNVVFNWGVWHMMNNAAASVNLVANYIKSGPATRSGYLDVVATAGAPSWYISSNYVVGFPAVTADNWTGVQFYNGATYSTAYAATPFTYEPISEQTAQAAYDSVIADVGCNFPTQDSVDARVIQEVVDGRCTYGDSYGAATGIIDSQASVGGWPTLAGGTPPTDTDGDGMPDSWETANGLNPSNAADATADADGDGYTNVEEYLNGLVAGATPPTYPELATFNLAWTATAGASGYRLLYGSTSGAPYANTNELGNVTSTQIQLGASGPYYLAVQAYAGTTNGSIGNEVTISNLPPAVSAVPDTGYVPFSSVISYEERATNAVFPAKSLQWSWPGGSAATNNATVTWSTPGTNTVWLVWTNVAGVVSNSVTVTALASSVATPVVVGNGVPILDGDTTPTLSDYTHFGAIKRTSGSVTRMFTLRNDGDVTLTLTGSPYVQLVGDADFTVVTQPSGTIPSGGSTTFSIKCDPSVLEPSATVSIAHDAGGSPYTFAMAAAAAEQEIVVSGSDAFGSAALGQSVDRTFTIENIGDAELASVFVTIDGDNAADWSVAVAPPATIAANSSATFTARFAPSYYGYRWANIHVHSDDADEPDTILDASGYGPDFPQGSQGVSRAVTGRFRMNGIVNIRFQ